MKDFRDKNFNPYNYVTFLKEIPVKVISKNYQNITIPFSVVITVKNEENNIISLLKSIFSQSLVPCGLTLIDGKSTDKTRKLTENFIESTKNQGKINFLNFSTNFSECESLHSKALNRSEGRNRGVESAEEEIIIFLDAGTKLPENFFMNMAGPFSEFPDCDLVGGVFYPEFENKYSPHFIPPSWNNTDFQTFLPSARAVAVKKSLFLKCGGFPPAFNYGEDTIFDINYRKLSRQWVINKDAFVYWRPPGSEQEAEGTIFKYYEADGESGVGDFRYYLEGRNSKNSRSSNIAIRAIHNGIVAGREKQARADLERRGIENSVLILSGVPFSDCGGGQRGAQIAREFLRREDYRVSFVNVYPSAEDGARKVYIDEDITRLSLYNIFDFKAEEFANNYKQLGEKVIVIMEFPHPDFLPIIDKIEAINPRARVVYDLIDNWESSLGWIWYTKETEEEIIKRSDCFLASARTLQESLQGKVIGSKVYYLPNAVNTNMFNFNAEYERPADLPEGKNIIYIGSLWGEWFDWDLLEYVAENLPPGFNIILIGGYIPQIKQRMEKKFPGKVFFLGLKPQSELPAYLRHSASCIMPFKVDKITNTVSPLKVFEYLAMGRPVISPITEEIKQIPLVMQAKNKEKFLHAAVASAERNPLTVEQVREFSKSNSWRARINALLEVLYGKESKVFLKNYTGEKDLVSVVLPVFNQVQFIALAIESILNQTYKPIELIIVNDGSTDGTEEVLRKYCGREGITVINNDSNLKLPAALNNGFSLARGEFLTWTSADNILDRDCIKTLVNYLKAHKEKAMAYSDYRTLNEAGEVADIKEFRTMNKGVDPSIIKLSGMKDLETGDNFIGASFLYRRDAALVVGEYDEGLFGAEDYDYWLRLNKLFEIGHIPEVLYSYRVHNNSLSGRAYELKIKDKVITCLEKNRRNKAKRLTAEGLIERLEGIKPVEKNNFSFFHGEKIPVAIQIESIGTGGLENVVFDLTRGIDREKFEVYLFVINGEKREVNAGAEVFFFEGNLEKLKEATKEKKIKLVNLHHSLTGVEFYRAAGVKTVYTIHNMYTWVNPTPAFFQIDKFVAVSYIAAEFFANKFKVSPAKIKEIPNGLNYSTVEVAPANTFKKKTGEFVLLNVASVREVKNQKALVEALTELDNVCLIVAGEHETEGGYFQEVMKLARNRGVESRVNFVGHVGRAELNELYRKADCFILPSFIEGWSLALMEAIYFNKPVIVSRVGGAAELLTEDPLTVFLSASPTAQEIARAVGRVKHNFPPNSKRPKKFVSLEEQIKLYEKEFLRNV